jgi:hypothetical protein
MDGGLMSPPPEDMATKAAKVLGVGAGLVGAGIGLSRSGSRRSRKGEDSVFLSYRTISNRTTAEEDDDIVMVGAAGGPPSPERPERRRPRVSQSLLSVTDTAHATES